MAMNPATRYARILTAYLTIGVIFATALSGGGRGKAPTPCPLSTFAILSEQTHALLSSRE